MVRIRLPALGILVVALVALGPAPGCGGGEEPPPVEKPSVVPGLLGDLLDDDATLRKNACAGLARTFPEGARAVPVLMAALGDDDAEVRAAASEALMALGREGVRTLARFCLGKADPSRRQLLRVLAEIDALGARVVGGDLARAGSGGDERCAVALMGLVDAHDPVDVETVLLARAGPGGEAGVCELACAALAVRGARSVAEFRRRSGLEATPDGEAAGPVREMLSDPERLVRWCGVRLCGCLGACDEETMAALRTLAETADEAGNAMRVSRAAAGQLAALGLPPPPADDPARWREELGSPEPEVRIRAAHRLAALGAAGADAAPVLVERLQEASGGKAWIETARALGGIGPAAEEAVRALDQGLRDEDARTRLAAAAALFRILPGDETARAVLESLLRHRDPEVVEAAVGAITALGPAARDLAPVLIEACDRTGLWRAFWLPERLGATEPAPEVLVPALVRWCGAAGDLPPPPTGDVFRRLVTAGSAGFDPGRELTINLLDLLVRAGPAAADAAPLLERMAGSPDDRIRYRARLGLRRIRAE